MMRSDVELSVPLLELLWVRSRDFDIVHDKSSASKIAFDSTPVSTAVPIRAQE